MLIVWTEQLKADGEFVERGEIICLLELDDGKACMEVQADETGIITWLKNAGDIVRPGEPWARIDPRPNGSEDL